MPLTGVHIHLLVNHAPVFGSLFALGLFVASYFYAPEVLRRTAFAFLIVTAGAAVIAYVTGDPAKHAIRGIPGVVRSMIDEHEEMGESSFIVASIVGAIALIALIRWRVRPIPRAATLLLLVGNVVVAGMMAYTAWLGGRIRHTEVRSGATIEDAIRIEPPPARQR
jgi:glucan phosphoethanolaminetransferase (alkaline phosphatase superfamily)